MSSVPAFGENITIKADGLKDEFRSVWTDLRHVSYSVSWVDVDGTSTRCLRAGNPNGPKLVMLHGTGGHLEVFAPNFAALGEHYDCYALDMIGHGYTDKPDIPYDTFFSSEFLRKFMDLQGIEKASLIGISVGAAHSLRFAETYPARVDKLILVTPFAAPMPEEGQIIHKFWIGEEQPPSDGRSDAAKEPTFEIAKKILSTVVADINMIPDDMIAARFDTARQPGAPEAFKHVMWWMNTERRLKNTFTKEQLAKIEHPTLAIVGANDPAFVPNGQGCVDAMPNCAGVVVEGASHWPNYEDPGSFNRLALEFLQQ